MSDASTPASSGQNQRDIRNGNFIGLDGGPAKGTIGPESSQDYGCARLERISLTEQGAAAQCSASLHDFFVGRADLQVLVVQFRTCVGVEIQERRGVLRASEAGASEPEYQRQDRSESDQPIRSRSETSHAIFPALAATRQAPAPTFCRGAHFRRRISSGRSTVRAALSAPRWRHGGRRFDNVFVAGQHRGHGAVAELELVDLGDAWQQNRLDRDRKMIVQARPHAIARRSGRFWL
jgi:hypothetical protein